MVDVSRLDRVTLLQTDRPQRSRDACGLAMQSPTAGDKEGVNSNLRRGDHRGVDASQRGCKELCEATAVDCSGVKRQP